MSSASSAVTYTSVYTDSESGRVIWGADEGLSDGAVMSSASSAVTYTSVYTDFEPRRVIWGADEGLSDGGSPRVIVDDADDDDKDEEDKEEEEEHLAPADSAVVIPTDKRVAPPEGTKPVMPPPSTDTATTGARITDIPWAWAWTLNGPSPTDSVIVIPTGELVSLPEGTEPIIPPPFTNTSTTGARITVQLQAAISFPPEAEVERLLPMPTPSPLPLASLSPPSTGERLARCMTPAALPSPPPLHMPPPVERRDDIPETEMPPRKRLCLSTIGFREVGYGIKDTWIDPTETVPEIAPMTVGEVNTRVTELTELHEHDTQDLYALLEDAHDSRTRIFQRVTVDSQRVDLLMEDRIAHQETIQIMEDKAYMQQTEIAELRETDRGSQAPMAETPRVMEDMRREMGDMQAELLAPRKQPRRAGQPGGDARVLNHQDAPRDADSHI
nr:hypothetical protein [Tanacetum cinerariifolium]